MLVMDLTATLALIYAELYLAPQLFYLYYHLIFEGLPHQWVLGRLPTLLDFGHRILSHGPENLSFHLQGFTARMLVVLTLLLHMKPTILTGNPPPRPG